jgi:hypothetical protein
VSTQKNFKGSQQPESLAAPMKMTLNKNKRRPTPKIVDLTLDNNEREHQETPTPGTSPFSQNSKKQKLNHKEELPTLEKMVHWQNAEILNYHPHHPVASTFIQQNNYQGFHAQAFAEKSMNPPLFPPAPSPLTTGNTFYPFAHKQQAHPQTHNTSILPHTLPQYTPHNAQPQFYVLPSPHNQPPHPNPFTNANFQKKSKTQEELHKEGQRGAEDKLKLKKKTTRAI